MADLNNFSARNITKKLDINDCGFVFFSDLYAHWFYFTILGLQISH